MEPYPYQRKVADLLLAGKNVVLQAPTGAGKTYAALLPFIYARRSDIKTNFPQKCVYSVPMRVLAHQFVEEIRGMAADYRVKFREEIDVRIQTGDQQDDRLFEGDLTFCTIDQFLSSYLTAPFSLSMNKANMNAGAFVGSYLVFDEFHLLDPDSSLPTTLFAIKQLSKVAPVLLMTATFSKEMLNELAQYLQAEVVLVSEEEARRIETRGGSYSPRQRTWHMQGDPLTAAAVLEAHKSRSLVICNTVTRAQEIHQALEDAIRQQDLNIDLILLHSRFLPDDRKQIENRIHELFGKQADTSRSVIAVATQVVEVGLDISCENLHTELAPASSLIQRAGRCARFPAQSGRVWVYPVESFLPYGRAKENKEQEGLWVKEMRSILAWLNDHQDEAFDFTREQALINAVAAQRDRAILRDLSAGRQTRREKIFQFQLGDRQPNDRRLLIRDADSRLVLIHSNPDELLRAPFAATGFNIQTTTLMGIAREWLERDVDVDWRVRFLAADEDGAEKGKAEYSWIDLKHTRQLLNSPVIVVNPELAGYSAKKGFLPGQGSSGFESTLSAAAMQQTWEGYDYYLEAYTGHIRHVLQALKTTVLPRCAHAFHLLEKAAGWEPGSLKRAAWLTALLHDVGKLSTGWQIWAHTYQQHVGNPVHKSEAVAHTDRQWGNELHRQSASKVHGKNPRPPHAVEGAVAVAGILAKGLPCKDLARAAVSAIARHHTPFAKDCQPYELYPYARDHIEQSVSLLPEEIRACVDLRALRHNPPTSTNLLSGLLVMPDELYAWLAYLMLARALRIADQQGTAVGMQELGK